MLPLATTLDAMDEKRRDCDDLPPDVVEALEELAQQLGLTTGAGYLRIDFNDKGEPTALLALPEDPDDLMTPDIDPPSPN